MPRSRGSSEMASQRQSSPRVPLHLRSTAASEANSLHRVSAERSSSPRPINVHEKKRATKLNKLEAKLGEKEEELKKAKDQLAAAEAANQNILLELEQTKKQIPIIVNEEPSKECDIPESGQQIVHNSSEAETLTLDPPATDVFEVIPWALASSEPEEEQADKEAAKNEIEPEADTMQMVELKAKLAEKDQELELSMIENVSLKKQVSEMTDSLTTAKEATDETNMKLHCVEEKLVKKKAESERLRELLVAAEAKIGVVEADMKRVKAQAEQWRKAAEAAAAVLADGERVDRCVSMEKNVGYASNWSPAVEEDNGGKRRGGGIRMFGDLWKKKGHHK